MNTLDLTRGIANRTHTHTHKSVMIYGKVVQCVPHEWICACESRRGWWVVNAKSPANKHPPCARIPRQLSVTGSIIYYLQYTCEYLQQYSKLCQCVFMFGKIISVSRMQLSRPSIRFDEEFEAIEIRLRFQFRLVNKACLYLLLILFADADDFYFPCMFVVCVWVIYFIGNIFQYGNKKKINY